MREIMVRINKPASCLTRLTKTKKVKKKAFKGLYRCRWVTRIMYTLLQVPSSQGLPNEVTNGVHFFNHIYKYDTWLPQKKSYVMAD